LDNLWMNKRLLMVICIFLLTSCQPSGSYVEWEYIIPDNYSGYLGIRFDCADGTPLLIQNNIVQIKFKPDGTYCTSSAYFPSWTKGDRAWTASGVAVPVIGQPWDNRLGTQAYAVCCGNTFSSRRSREDNSVSDIIVYLQWAGDMAKINASWPASPDNLDNFLYKAFDHPLPLFNESTKLSQSP
jgi:hypothetical protein